MAKNYYIAVLQSKKLGGQIFYVKNLTIMTFEIKNAREKRAKLGSPDVVIHEVDFNIENDIHHASGMS